MIKLKKDITNIRNKTLSYEIASLVKEFQKYPDTFEVEKAYFIVFLVANDEFNKFNLLKIKSCYICVELIKNIIEKIIFTGGAGLIGF